MISVTSTMRTEIDWLYRGVGRFFPEAWARFRDFPALAGTYRLPTDSAPPVEGLLVAYSQMMENPDIEFRIRAAAERVAWEDAVISQGVNGSPGSYSDRVDDARLAFVRICSHYFSRGAFLEDGVLIREAGKLAGIPRCADPRPQRPRRRRLYPMGDRPRLARRRAHHHRGLRPHRQHRDDRGSARCRRPPLPADDIRQL
jgi:hypothetical protein